MWAWKYSLSLQVAITRAKVSFSIGGYLSSAPRSAQLVGFYTLSSSLTKSTLTVVGDMAR